MMRRLALFIALVTLLTTPEVFAAVGLTTVPVRDGVRLTIYNGVDLTLMQEYRTLVLRKGLNRIQYQWSGTLIDSTSLELRPLSRAGEIEVSDVVYPKGAPATLIWEVRSEVEGPVRFEISGFTSGLSWTADYSIRANAEETKADVEGFVAITNGSGEDYVGAEVRLVVGTVNLVETIRDLATQQVYQRTRTLEKRELAKERSVFADAPRASVTDAMPTAPMAGDFAALKAPVVESRRLADYHLFTISGTHGLSNGATTRVRALATTQPMALEVLCRVPFLQPRAETLYRFVNDAKHELPEGPLPEGTWHVFRTADAKSGQLAYAGRATHAYVPPGQKVELPLGVDPAIAVKQEHQWHRETGHQFNTDDRVTGWYVHDAYRFRLVNTRSIPVSVEYLVGTPGGEWKITGLEGERRDANTFRVQERVEQGRALELGPFVVTSAVGSVSDGKKLPAPPDAADLPRVQQRP